MALLLRLEVSLGAAKGERGGVEHREELRRHDAISQMTLTNEKWFSSEY